MGSKRGTRMIGKRGGRRGAEARLLLFGTAAGLVMTAAGTAEAAGFYLQEQSVRGLGPSQFRRGGRSGPGVAVVEPGGDRRHQGARSVVRRHRHPSQRQGRRRRHVDRPAGGSAGRRSAGLPELRDPIVRGVAPNNAFALPLGDRIAIGLAVTAPFSFTSDYDPSGWQRYSAIRSRLITLDIQPSIAVAGDRLAERRSGAQHRICRRLAVQRPPQPGAGLARRPASADRQRLGSGLERRPPAAPVQSG